MSAVVKLSEELINQARKYSVIYKRSIPKQIEYWSHIGKTAEENPDLPYSFIKDIFLALNEVKNNEVEDYVLDQE